MKSLLFNAQQIDALRTEYATVERIDPCLPTYKSLCRFLDRLDSTRLIQLARAGIKWISPLALNCCTRRGVSAWTINAGPTS